MQYNIILTNQDIEIISTMLKEWPYRAVKPILDNIASQVDMQNTNEETLTEIRLW